MSVRAVKDSSLSIVFGLLMVVTLAGQAIAGTAVANLEAQAAGLAEISIGHYVTSSTYAADVAENWQSEYLQFTLYVLVTIWLVQRGSSESKAPEETGLQSDEEQLVGRFARPDSPTPAKSGGLLRGMFSVSLTVVMASIFLFSWAAQAVAGRVAMNQGRLRDLLDPVSLGQYLQHPDFWNRTLQNWQSELLAVGSMAIFAVFLRQRGSPESKPVGAPNEQTGSS